MRLPHDTLGGTLMAGITLTFLLLIMLLLFNGGTG